MAHTFTDAQGSDWIVKMTPVTLAQVEDQLGVDFASEPDDNGGPVIRLMADCMFAFRVLWILCEKQATDRGLSSEDFGDRLVGDTLGKAQRSLCHAMADFYPDARRREAVARVYDVLRAAEDRLMIKASQNLESLDVDKLVSEVLDAS